MLKKRKHKIKRRNTEPSVNHPLVLATQSTGQQQQQVPSVPAVPEGAAALPGDQQQQYFNLADICDSPTHATAV